MPQDATTKVDDRIFVRNGRRHYRREYSITEFRVGFVVLALLLTLLAWVAWMGAHPDPDLYATDLPLLASGAAETATPQDRGPLPEDLSHPGWSEGTITRFDAEDLYKKINGREGYYKSFGFEALYFVSLLKEDDPTTIVDIEMFDLGSAANALGAYAGERSKEVVPEVREMGMSHFDRNALFMTRGKFYVRAIGSDETAVIQTQLESLHRLFQEQVHGEALPWGFALFVGKLGLGTERVSFMPENAFSFGFARDVYSALLDDDETEMFVAIAQSRSDAEVLVEQFVQGFSRYGSPAGATDGVQWIEDRYIKTIAGTTQVGSSVVGVRGAPDIPTATAELSRLRTAVASLALTPENNGTDIDEEPSR